MNRDFEARSRPGPLNGWRAIADYMGRNQSTVKRWARDRGLPVHRPEGGPAHKGVPVYAFATELDTWLRGQTASDDDAGGVVPVSLVADPSVTECDRCAAEAPHTSRRRLVGAAVLGATLMIGSGAAAWWGMSARSSPDAIGAIPAEARQLYLRGTYLWNRRTPESITEAIPAFERALAIYPDYADAHAGLAMTYNLARQYSGMSGAEAYPLAEAAARRAVELDPGNAFAQSVLAFVEFHWLWDVNAGLARFERALRLDPNSANTLMWHASSLIHLGRANEAVSLMERAQQLDPGNSTILMIKAQALFFSGDRQGGHALIASLIANDPNHAWNYYSLSQFRLMEGDHARALESYAKVGDLIRLPRYRRVAEAGLAALRAGGVEAMGSAMATVDVELFEKEQALAWDVARAWAMAGDAENAVKWLRISYERHEERLIGIWYDAAMRPIRNDSAYRQMVAKTGLSMVLS